MVRIKRRWVKVTLRRRCHRRRDRHRLLERGDLRPHHQGRGRRHRPLVAIGGLEAAALGSDFDGATVVGWDTSELAAITQELVDRGYDDGEIAAVMGGNTIRVLRETLPD